MKSANSYQECMNLNKIRIIEAWNEDNPGNTNGFSKVYEARQPPRSRQLLLGINLAKAH